MSKLARTPRANRQIFQPLLEEAKKVLPLLRAVVQGDIEKLKQLDLANSALLFKKGQVTDPNGTTFYQASPYLLMKFLADSDMLNQMNPFLAPYGKERREQDAEIDSGGADLVKMDKDPTTVPFEQILIFKTMFTLEPEIPNPPHPPQTQHIPTEIEFPLLENEDGIIFYNNQFFYANKKTETVVPINYEVHSEAEFTALEQLKASFNDMVDNSSRRSSNDEHALITNTMQQTLKRKGILYERNAQGADLVRVSKDPQSLQFEEIAQLMKNPDGILFYRNQGLIFHKDNFYYANKETKKVELINPALSSNPEQANLDKEALEKLKTSFIGMIGNTTRHSDKAEHGLIERTMGHALQRHTVRYCDSRADFNRLLNAYRKYAMLFQQQKWNECNNYWRQEVGRAQRDVMWLLQRYCEEGRPFFPLPDFKASSFRRGFNIIYGIASEQVTLLQDGHIVNFGSDIGIYKSHHPLARVCVQIIWTRDAAVDLVAVTHLVEDAKANVVEFSEDQDLENSNENLARGPG